MKKVFNIFLFRALTSGNYENLIYDYALDRLDYNGVNVIYNLVHDQNFPGIFYFF